MKKTTVIKIGTALGLACAAALPALMVAPGKASKAQKAPFMGRNIAHRGLHTRDKSVPENSLSAFRSAVENGYGVELDVQLSKDGQVVVFHDDTLSRVCGVDARVDELTLDELRELRLCGTDETIPLFSEVLDIIGGRTPIICELKTGRNNRQLCKKTCSLIKAYGGTVCIESFDPTIVAWFRRHAPELLRGQLASPAAEYTKDGRPAWQGFVLSHTLLNFLARPQFIAYKIGKRPALVRLSEKLGAMVVGWTSHASENEEGRDTVIFEFYHPRVWFK